MSGRWRVGGNVGPFRLEQWLGAGGMGEVWAALDTRLDRRVALKRLPAGAAPEAWERFRREARLQARISSPHVATLYDIGGLDEGEPYLVMELIEGESLASVLRRGPLPVQRALEIERGIAAGLAAAHRAGVIHRDLKPANVIVGEDGTPVLVDFGVALLAPEQEREADSQQIVGTPDWIAPEVWAGGEITPAADVWAAGVILFQMLTGHHPFAGRHVAERLAAVVTGAPRNLRELRSDVPAAVIRVVAACLEREPARRIRNGEELLQRIPVSTVPVAVRRPRLLAPEVVAGAAVYPPLGRRRLIAVLAAGFAAVGLAVAGGSLAWGPVARPWLRPSDAADRVVELTNRAGVPVEGLHRAAGYTTVAGAPAIWVRLSPRPLLDPEQPPAPNWPVPHHPGEVRALLEPSGRLLRWEWWPEAGIRPRLGPLLAAAGAAQPARHGGSAGTDPRGITLHRLLCGSGLVLVVGTVAEVPVVVAREGIRPPPEKDRLDPPTASLLLLLVVAGGTVAAWRRWRKREADLPGALALAGVLVAAHMAKLVPNPVTFTTGIWFEQLDTALGIGAVLGVLYLGVEPLVRALWPGAMASWIRFLRGGLWDPDVVRGLAVGTAVGLPAAAAWFTVATGGSGHPEWQTLLGVGSWGKWLFGFAYLAERSVAFGFLTLLGAAALGRLLRRPWLALVASAVVISPALFWPEVSGSSRPLLVVLIAVLVPLAVRAGGLLALITLSFTFGCGLNVLPPAAGTWTLPFSALSVAVALLPSLLAAAGGPRIDPERTVVTR